MFYFIFFNLKVGYWDYMGVDDESFIPNSVPLEDRFDTIEICIDEINKRDGWDGSDNKFYHYVYQDDEGIWKYDETFSLEAEQVKRIPKNKIIVLGKGDMYYIEAKTKAFDLNYHNFVNPYSIKIMSEM